MREKWYKITELADKLNIPHQTLRRYLTNHKHLIRIRKQHKAYNIHEESIPVIKNMRGLYEEGKTTEEVDRILTDSGVPVTIDIKNDEGKREKHEIGEILTKMNEKLEKQADRLGQQDEHIRSLTESIQKQNEILNNQSKYIEESLERRDRLLVESLRESMQSSLLLASAKEEENNNNLEKKSFWEKLKYLFKG